MKVLAALSGGVDSAVAAARAVDAGHDVTAVHLALARDPKSHREGARGCCSLEDARDARRAADVVGIPFYVWDLAERFERDVIDDFIAEYAAGRTPNPCLRCNEKIKFAAVLDRARELGFDAVCTGHYARLVEGPSGRELHRAVDHEKDQSYVLGVLEQWQIDSALFPLGDSRKADVRIEATQRGLLVADKPDSHDVCFVPDGDNAAWLRSRIGAAPGEVVDAESGETVGTHEGAYAYTVGQRRGLALGRPAPDGARRYVVDVDVERNIVSVGPPTLLRVDYLEAQPVRWCGHEVPAGTPVDLQVRAHADTVAAELVSVDGPTIALATAEPVVGVAAGQAAVMYVGTRVIGSATITKTSRVGVGQSS